MDDIMTLPGSRNDGERAALMSMQSLLLEELRQR